MASFWRKYGAGTGADVIIPMIKAGATDHATSSDWTPAAGDVKVSKDGGAAANIGTLPTYIASVGWKFVFSDAELQCARLSVQVTDSATKAVEDQHFMVETYGHSSAQHAVDLDDSVRAGLTALPNAAADAAGGLPVSDAGGLDLDTLNSNVSAILADTGTDGVVVAASSKAGYTISGTITTLDALDTAQDTQHSATRTALGDGTVVLHADYDAAKTAAQAGDEMDLVNAPNATAVTAIQSGLATAANLATVAGYVDTEIGTIITHLTDIKGATFNGSTDSLEAIRDRGDSAWVTATSVTVSDKTGFSLASDGLDLVTAWTVDITGDLSGSVGSVTGSVGGNVTGSVGSLATQAKADVNAEVDTALTDIHLDHLLAATYDPASKPGAADALLNELVENDGGVARFTANALEEAPTGGSAPTAVEIRQEMDANSTQLADIVSTLGIIDQNVDSVLADTGELQTDWANGGRLDLILDQAAGLLTTAMTESYAEQGVTVTPAQALYMILQRLTEQAIVGTTVTVKKLDRSTTAFTLTLDDAETATSSTRAT